MLVFIDESGDPGLKLASGSSPVFVIALVIFKTNEEADFADRDIAEFRAGIRFRPDAEFKFNKLSDKFRRMFLEKAARYQFQFYGIVINKAGLYGKGFQYKESFYKYVCGLVFKNAKTHLQNATVIIDGSGDRGFQRELGTYLKNQINSKTKIHVKKVKMEDSHRNNLIQLADMVSGAIYRAARTDRPDASFHQLIKAREIYVQRWPK
jgi:hypothetical protein